MRIGYASAAWGDDPSAPSRLLERADLDYVGMDYLAEITMAILKRQQDDDPDLGYARDFPDLVAGVAERLVADDVTLVSNAGGVNPVSCVERILEVTGDVDLTVAAVTGDDVLDATDALRERGVSLDNADTGERFEDVSDDLVAANAYLGAFPIADAVERGADVVVTGRCVDAALVLGPAIHEFDLGREDHDRLASGVVAGHVLECGTQATGGVFMEGWQDVDVSEMGYPIAEIEPSGDFVVTKPEGTGGTVSEATVKEQLVYEIKDPSAYRTPDVVADFTSLSLETVDEDRVRVTGCRGDPAPESLKVGALYADGYKSHLLFIYSWPDALAKARKADEIVRDRIDDLPFEEVRTEFLGYDGCHDGIAPEPDDPNEIVLRVAVKADEADPVYEFGKRVMPVLLWGPPNVTPVVEGRPKPDPVISFWPCTIPRDAVDPEVTVRRTGGEA